MISRGLIERIRDVGIVLYCSNKYYPKVGRLQLQKLVYLVDVLSLCRHLLIAKHGHETYHHGPYDSKIQNAVDILAFWGLAHVSDINVLDQKIYSKYSISTAGEEWVEDLVKSSEAVQLRYELTNEICDVLNIRGGFRRIKDLVYAEPTYSRVGKKGYGYYLDLANYENNLSSQIITKMKRMYESDKIDISVRFMADFLIEFLERKAGPVLSEWDD